MNTNISGKKKKNTKIEKWAANILDSKKIQKATDTQKKLKMRRGLN